MKAIAQISFFSLVCFGGALAGALISDSGTPHSANARHLAGSESQLEIATLREDVARLRVILERDRQRVDDAVAEDLEDYEEPDLEEMIARDRDIAERRAAAITAAAEREAVDPDWAPAVELQIAEGLAAHGPSGATLISTVCKTTLCIAEIEHPPGDDGTGHVNWLVVFGLSHGFFMRHEPESGAGARTVAYLARDGHSLPRAEPSSAG
ncbi:hypothetical protein ENSA5_47360 [Enhygromyxa salina]|uniref:Uncharacterized protein n=1 Tax=Enhygromyxa salina TaxID=215803 RepID=A0A2S9XIZ8_9BACT|nr:hypothetical protein [Enhygromyxa salina]PRP92823.1 hypothetical protein ENSA5_47360 [Enhygromyxa salina]